MIASVGNSHMRGQGASKATFQPVEQFATAMRLRLPGWNVVVDQYAVADS